MKLKGNFTQIPNKILEALIKAKLTRTEKDIVWVVCRETFGWAKETAKISNGRFAEFTGLPRSYCIKCLKKLRGAKIIIKILSDTRNTPHYYKVNNNLDGWKPMLKTSNSVVTSHQLDTKDSNPTVTNTDDQPVTQQIKKKENKDRTEFIKKQIREKHSRLWRKEL